MPSIRFRLDPPTLNGLAARVRAEYGPDARIVDTEERRVGGVGGFFARRVIDVTVDLPDAPGGQAAHEFSVPRRVGLMALLDEADAADALPAHLAGAAAPVGTADPFARSLRSAVAGEPQAPAVRRSGGEAAPGAAPVAAAAAPRGAAPRTAGQAPLPQAQSAVATARPGVEAGIAVSTEGGRFASVLDQLRLDVDGSVPTAGGASGRSSGAWEPRRGSALELADDQPRPIHRAAQLDAEEVVYGPPEPRSRVGVPGARAMGRARPGDMLIVAGLGDDAMRVAESVRERLGVGCVCEGGALEGRTRRRVDDRRGALAVRAYGVRSEQPIIVAYGLGDGDPADPNLARFVGLGADQVWLVVDATRKTEDTKRWVARIRARVQVDGIASIRTRQTNSPDSLAELGLPEAWSDRNS